MALLARTFRTFVGLPWSAFELLDGMVRWSAVPVVMEEPISEMWAEDLFAPSSSKCWGLEGYDDVTDSSGSEICDEEDEEQWSCSESEEEQIGISFEDGELWGDRWFWSVSQEDEDWSDVELSTYVVGKLVDYVMPSMTLDMDDAVNFWIDKYGSSRSQIRYVTVSISEQSAVDKSSVLVLPSSSTGLFVAVL